jgi:hypothetical protein
MANETTLAHCLVLIDKRAALLCVAFEAGFVLIQESKAASFKPLLNVCRGTLCCDPFVRFMAIAATHFALEHRMMMRQLKRCANVEVTLETSVRRLSRIDDCALSAASLNVQTPGAVTRLAAHVFCVFALCLQSRVSGCAKIAHDLFVTCCAFFRAHKLRAGNAGWSKNRSVGRAAGEQNHSNCDGTSGAPQQTFAPTADPSSYSGSPHESRVCAQAENCCYAFFQVFPIAGNDLVTFRMRLLRRRRILRNPRSPDRSHKIERNCAEVRRTLEATRLASRYCVGDFPENFLKTRLNCESD